MSKSKKTSPTKRAYNALANSLNDPNADNSGYLRDLQDNLLPGIEFDLIRSDIEKGAGNELEQKFLAIHSSTALAVNAFGLFKSSYLCNFNRHGKTFERPVFERRCPTGLRGTAPNLDVWFAAAKEAVVAVESKLTEYFKPKKAEFSDSYCDRKLPGGEPCWWNVLAEAKTAGKRHLDVAQLVKHYFGLRRHMCDNQIESVELLYVFWEPTNAAEIECCVQHRQEIELLKDAVVDSEIKFSALSYSELWQEWDQVPALQVHVANLRDRYEIKI